MKENIMNKFLQSSFARFFTCFPRLLLAELLFSIPFVVFTGIFILIGYLTGFNNIILWGLGIIPAAPFFSGLVMVVRKYSVEKQSVNVIKTFFGCLKENLKKSLFNGVVFYAIVSCSFFAILYYSSLAETDIVFGSVLTLYIIFTFLLLAMMFYIPLLTITYELRLKDIYKNSFLLVFGKILRNLIAMIMLLALSAIAFLAILYSEGIWLVVSVSLTVILYPLTATYIVNSVIAKGVQETVGYFTGNNIQYVLSAEEEAMQNKAVENADNTSDYVFVNGRMIKNTNKPQTDAFDENAR